MSGVGGLGLLASARTYSKQLLLGSLGARYSLAISDTDGEKKKAVNPRHLTGLHAECMEPA